MFEQFLEKGKASLKPLTDLVSVNSKAIEKMAAQQSSYVSELFSESFKQVQDLSSKRDIGSIIESQKAYAEHVQKKWMENAKSTLEMMNEVRQSSTQIIETAVKGEKAEKSGKKAA